MAKFEEKRAAFFRETEAQKKVDQEIGTTQDVWNHGYEAGKRFRDAEVAEMKTALAQAEEQTKMEVVAAYQDAAEVAWNAYDRDDGDDIKECVLRCIPSHHASLSERRMNEARLEEAKSIPVHLWPQSVGELKAWNMYRTMRIETLEAELRKAVACRATAGEGRKRNG
jgi:hypothetical protein